MSTEDTKDAQSTEAAEDTDAAGAAEAAGEAATPSAAGQPFGPAPVGVPAQPAPERPSDGDSEDPSAGQKSLSGPTGSDIGRTFPEKPLDPPGGRRAVLIWSVGVAVYFVAVVFRTSLGVAGLEAADRFDVGASALSTFSIMQLLLYAGMQIPVGLLVDRLGTRRVLTIGVVLFTVGQLGFALAPSYSFALASRALLGCGDALTFISVLRLGTRWFPARRGPVVAQLAGLVGMAGSLVSTLALAPVLHQFGWTVAFAGSSVCGVLVLVLLRLFLRDHPEGHAAPPVPHQGLAFVRAQIAASWREPGTKLGLWVHFTTQFPAMFFLLLWGVPFLVESQGLSRSGASGLLTLVVCSNLVVGLAFGQAIQRFHAARMPIVLGTVASSALLWAAVLAWPGEHTPLWLLVVLCTALGACGPASMVGFDYSRPANPAERQGTASGIVNMGGFVASMVTLFAVGVLLDLTGDAYRIAFCSIFVLQALGLSQILRLHPRTAREELAREERGRQERSLEELAHEAARSGGPSVPTPAGRAE